MASSTACLTALTMPPESAADEPWLVESAAAVGLDFVHQNGMTGALYLAEIMGSGAALFDYDGDGDLDAYLVQSGPLGGDVAAGVAWPVDRLFRNELIGVDGATGPLRFTDVTDASGLDARGYGMGTAIGDIDSDGDLDLYVTNLGANQMWRNEGDGTFRDITLASGTGDRGWGVAAAFFDYDRDGFLDLFVGNYSDFSLAAHKDCGSELGTRNYCGPTSYAQTPDRLFRNRGDGTFEDVSARTGIAVPRGAALGVVSADYDGDGWLDAYVANDQTPNRLWLNRDGKTFVDEAVLGGCAVNEEGQPEASMGVLASDFDGDGDPDIFVTHLTRETNTLYLNDGQGFFLDSSRESGLGLPSFQYTGFGTALFDLDNDGWLDVYITNGAVQRLEALVRVDDPHPLRQPDQLYRNLGGGRFEEVTAKAGPAFSLIDVGRGVAVGDVDNDGTGDLLVTNNHGPARLLLNHRGRGVPWLGLSLFDTRGAVPETAQVIIRRGEKAPLWRRVTTGGSFASSSDPRILVGLGTAPATGIEVRWPSGRTETFALPPSGRYSELREGTGKPVS